MKQLLKYFGVIFLTTILLGCQKPPSSVNPPTEDVINDVGAYFPIEAKLTWNYQGEGNEYASFTRRVMHQQGYRAQFAQDNGGTKMAMVYEIAPGEVKRTFFVPEFYTDENMLNEPSNQSEVILKAPLKVGAVWQDDKSRREVLAIREKVTVPAGTFVNVVKIKVTPLQGGAQGSQLLEYYAPNVGLILREFSSGENFQVVSKLQSYVKTEATILNQPQSKIGSITIEGMQQEMMFVLFDGAPLPFFTYIPQDMLAERITTSEARVYKFYANFAGEKRSDAYLSLFFYPEGTTMEQTGPIIEALAKSAGWERTQSQTKKRYTWSVQELDFRHKANNQYYIVHVGVGQHKKRLFYVLTYYPPEFGDGFAPRKNKILEEWVWTDTNEKLK